MVLACLAVPARAQEPGDSEGGERILQYHSLILVQRDASLQVRETILVLAQGQRIIHGIYRDFPTAYRDRWGNRYRVRFEFLGATRDGAPEPARLHDTSSGVRIYLGNPATFVSYKIHEYILDYRVSREIGFFENHDELYWNVTGNAWEFPIDRAAATVVLPDDVPRSEVHLEGYTGPEGAQEHDFSAEFGPDREAAFTSTRPLGPGEGLTIVLTWPKGYVTEPTERERMEWLLEDNRAGFVALAGLLLVVLYEFGAWWAVGRDPLPGAIMPVYESPDGLSPAALRYLQKMGYDDKAFASLIVSLAAKNYIEISEEKSLGGATYVLHRTGSKADLAPEEQMVANRLFETSDTLRLEAASHARVSAAIKSLKKSLATRMEKIYFLRNGKYLIPGLLLSALTFVAVVAAADPQARPIALFMSLWLSIWTLGVAMLGFRVVSLWRGAFHAHGLGKLTYIGALFMTAFAIPFFAGELFGLYTFAQAVSFIGLAGLVAIAAANFIFHELLKAPTHSGRALLDKVEGFKMFLGATTDPEHLGVTVNNDVATFEKYLPYAMALDLEEKWTPRFSHAVTAAAAAGSGAAGAVAIQGASLAMLASSAGGISDFASSFSIAVSMSSSAPGSSSGSGGGGSSGGGGGGGGGGGW